MLNGAGKHPIGAGGRGDGWLAPVKDPDDIPAGANIGLKTGHASGVFALDVDPKNGGDARLAELEAEYGALPATWMQQTGSGGYHYVFSLPEEFTPTNSRGRLPVGLDIRGEGGQIVLAPSVSGVGPYRETQPFGTRTPTAAAPGWLCELIRPLPPIAVPEGMESAFMPERTTDRGQAYAQAAVSLQLAELDLATPGVRNQTAFGVACRLIELSNAPWSGLSEVDAAQYFRRAGWALVDSTFTERELWACWTSAARKIGAKAAVLPAPPGGLPVGMDWGGLGGPPVAPPFSSSGGSATAAAPPREQDSASDPFEHALPSMGPLYRPGGSTASTPAVVPSTTGPVNPLDALLIPRSQIARIPRPAALIRGTLWRDTDAWLIGASGSGKSFIALDWAAHVAAGREWNNRRTVAGRVLYLVAEGASGIQQRLDAWEAAQAKAAELVFAQTGERVEPASIPDELIILPAPVQAVVREGRSVVLSPGWRYLLDVVARMRPALIVLDTQARISLGLNENDNAEMGQFIEAVGALRRHAAGACVLVVHHTGRSGGDARGASAIDGAQDVEWKVERRPGQMTGELVMEKNKNGADGVRHPFTLVSHRLGWDPEEEEYVTSLTVDWSPAFAADAEPEHRTMAAQVQEQILEVLREGSLTAGATKAEIRRKVNILRRGLGLPLAGERTVDYALDSSGTDRAPGLLQKELVTQQGARFADRERADQA